MQSIEQFLHDKMHARSPMIGYGDHIFVKHEGMGKNKSHKARSAAYVVYDRIRNRKIPESIGDRSSGSWAGELSEIAAMLKIQSTWITAGEPDFAIRKTVEDNGGRFVVVKNNADRRAVLEQYKSKGHWSPDQHNNPLIIRAFRETLGKEAADDLRSAAITSRQLRFVCAAVGTGGSAAGLSLGLKDAGYKDFELIGCDTTESIVANGRAQNGDFSIPIPGVGSKDEVCRTFQRAKGQLSRPLIRTSPLLASKAAAQFQQAYPIGCGMSSGLALATAERVLLPELKNGEKILLLFCDSAERYQSQLEFGKVHNVS